jgi:hypothetical protein
MKYYWQVWDMIDWGEINFQGAYSTKDLAVEAARALASQPYRDDPMLEYLEPETWGDRPSFRISEYVLIREATMDGNDGAV